MKIGVELYTLRDHLKTPEDIWATLKRVAEMGYTCVELAGIPEIDPARLAGMLEEHGLRAGCTHTNPDLILHKTDAVITAHQTLGCPYVGMGMMPNEYLGSLDGARRFIREFTPAAEQIAAAGMKLVYHNHAFEFEKFGGVAVFDVMVDESDPALWGFEPDLYWVQVGGRNPAALLRRLSGRVDVCHFKDLAVKGFEQRMAPVMEGNLDWNAIIAACRETGVSYAMVEQDDVYDACPFDELAKSRRNLLAAGL